MPKAVLLISLLSSALFLSGCQTAKRVGTFFFPPAGSASQTVPMASAMGAIPSSGQSYDDALRKARNLTGDDQSLRVGQVAATGSMRPYLGESALVVLEQVRRDQIKNGALLAFTARGAEYIHICKAVTPDGVVAVGSKANTEELVPFDRITGTALAVLYFDPTTAPRDRSELPLLLAASGDQVPASAGTLRILGASMLSGTTAAVIQPTAPGEYKVALNPHDALSLKLGVPGSAKVPTAESAINWASGLAGKTVKFQIYHPAAPETGVVLVYATFLQ